MSKALKALVMTTSQEDQIKYGFITKDHLSGEDVKTKETMYDDF
jgi:hypothetical protein